MAFLIIRVLLVVARSEQRIFKKKKSIYILGSGEMHCLYSNSPTYSMK